jgi:alcohol dehydrogenase
MTDSRERVFGAILEECGRGQPYASTRPLTISQVDLDPPGEGEVLLGIEVAGVCHSDLSVVNGTRVRPTPMLLGHEASGVVETVGPNVSRVSVGDRVVITFLPRCRECDACKQGSTAPCLQGSASNAEGTLLSGSRRLWRDGESVHHHLGVSAFASRAIVHENSVVRVPQDLPAHIAALLGCAVLTGGGAVKNAGELKPGQSLAIIGLGGVGMAALLVAKALGADPIHVIDAQQDKVDLAVKLGATSGFTPESVPDELRAQVVVEAAGNIRAFEAGIALTAPGGKFVSVGLPDPESRYSLSPLELVASGKSVIGSYLGSSDPERDIPIYIDLWRKGLLPLENLVSAEIPLHSINTAMDDLASGKALRQIIRFEREKINNADGGFDV